MGGAIQFNAQCVWRIAMCVCSECTRMCGYVLSWVPSQKPGYIVLCLPLLLSLPWDRSLTNRKLTISARLAGQGPLGISLPPPTLRCWLTGLWEHTWPFCGYWKFELRSSCLQSKRSYTLSHLPTLARNTFKVKTQVESVRWLATQAQGPEFQFQSLHKGGRREPTPQTVPWASHNHDMCVTPHPDTHIEF